jgi:hypothetical protein
MTVYAIYEELRALLSEIPTIGPYMVYMNGTQASHGRSHSFKSRIAQSISVFAEEDQVNLPL